MRPPALELVEDRSRLGAWRRDSRTIALARRLLADHGWGTVVEVLKHEMAHQFVDEVLGLRDVPAHGSAFRQVCEERAIDARAAGKPAEGRPPAGAQERVLERVARLLALAGSPNEHEARAAAAAAQRLMLKYNLEAAAAGAERRYGFRHVGRATGRTDEARRLLANILAEHCFVEAIWVPVWRAREGKRGVVLELCGTAENLELAEYLHAFLEGTAERLWLEYRRAGRVRGNAERRTYLSGVMTGFAETLRAQGATNRAEGLVWVGDRDLQQFLRRRYPRVRWTRYGGSRRTAAWLDGCAAGRKIVVHRGIHDGPSTGARPLLPAHRG
ncbi:MAG: SprT-like domain-containing protein [Deltaproteobacteria bacterium]|nr:SprT-like domain-containing protein [Deltaproteobacteria bacterium]